VSSCSPLSSGCRNAAPQRSGVKPRSSEQGEGPIRISIEKGFEFPKRELQRDLALGGKFAGALAVVVGIGGAFLAGPTRRTRQRKLLEEQKDGKKADAPGRQGRKPANRP